MDLWIRTQDKEILLKVDRFGIEEYNNDYGIVTYERIGTKKEFGLGLYKTKERSIEIINELQKALTHYLNNPYIYEMPKE